MKKVLLCLAMIMALCIVFTACSGENADGGSKTAKPSGSKASASATAASTPTAVPATPTPEPAPETRVAVTVKDLIYTSVVNVEYNGKVETWEKELSTDMELDLDDMELYVRVPNDGSEVEIKALLQENAPYKITGWSGDAESDSETIKFVPTSDKMNLVIEVEPLFDENVAESSKVTCSVYTEENIVARWGADLLTDGDINTRFSTTTISDVDANTLELGEPVTIDIDMGEAKRFNTICLFPRTDTPDFDGGVPNYPFGFDIQVSADGTTFETVYTVNLEENVNDMVQTYAVGDQNAQYIRLNVRVLGNMAADEGTAAVPYRIQFAELMAIQLG